MTCNTCTYRNECPSAVIDQYQPGYGTQARVIDLIEYRQIKDLEAERWEDKLFGEIDEVFARTWRWVIGMGIVYILAQLLRVWLRCVNS